MAKRLGKISKGQLKRSDDRLLYKIDLVLKGLGDEALGFKEEYIFRLFK
jgi:hypothetical protein